MLLRLPQSTPAILILLSLIGIYGCTQSTAESTADAPSVQTPRPNWKIEAVWGPPGSEKTIAGWTLEELGRLKKVNTQEKDFPSGKLISWKGVLLANLVDSALEKLPLEAKAQIDLIVLKGDGGAQALIPRSLITKYPLLLGVMNSDSKSGDFSSVIPWTSKPKILSEDLPLESFQIQRVSRIELTHYREKYGALFLKRRTDPAAMRGEKLFVQNCVSCHGQGRGPALSTLSQAGHPVVQGAPKISEKERRSLLNYLEAHRLENPAPSTASATGDPKSVRQ